MSLPSPNKVIAYALRRLAATINRQTARHLAGVSDVDVQLIKRELYALADRIENGKCDCGGES